MNNYGFFLKLKKLAQSKDDESTAQTSTSKSQAATSSAKEQTEFASQELQSARQDEIVELEVITVSLKPLPS